MRLPPKIIALILALAPFSLRGADKAEDFEGELTVTETRGAVSIQTIYTRKEDQLRIASSDNGKSQPINIVDAATRKLTIVYPHNSSFVVVDLAKTGIQPEAPDLPPGSSAPSPPPRPGLAFSPPPGFRTPPPMPLMPPRPNNPLASNIPTMLVGMPTMHPSQGFPAPGMPPMPGVGGFGAPAELKKTDKTSKIQGFDCTLYTISDQNETFEIWALPDAELFPFRLLQMNYENRHFGPRLLGAQWVELLQKQSLFPMEATLRTNSPQPLNRVKAIPEGSEGSASDPGLLQLAFKVDKIDRKKINDEKLFQPPEGYFQMQSPAL